MDSTFPAASKNRVYYTPETYPLTLTVGVKRDGTTITVADTVHADAANERYYVDLASGECVAGLYRFAWLLTSGSNTRTDVEYGICTEGGPLTLLASPDDLIAFGHVDSDGDPIGWGFLAAASLRVKRYAKQKVLPQTGDVVSRLDYPYNLPQRPVTGVTSVVDANDATLVEGSDYTLVGNRLDMGANHGKVTVTYDHGFTVVPEELREVVCAVAHRLADVPQGVRLGARSEGADGETTTWGMDAYSGVADLTSSEREVIDRFYPSTRKTGRSVDVL